MKFSGVVGGTGELEKSFTLRVSTKHTGERCAPGCHTKAETPDELGLKSLYQEINNVDYLDAGEIISIVDPVGSS